MNEQGGIYSAKFERRSLVYESVNLESMKSMNELFIEIFGETTENIREIPITFKSFR